MFQLIKPNETSQVWHFDLKLQGSNKLISYPEILVTIATLLVEELKFYRSWSL